jgi:CBS domain containing-hemolysin-like protein
MRSAVALAVLAAMLALRALAAAAEVLLAGGSGLCRRPAWSEAILASAAGAAARVACATSVGVVASLVWSGAGRAFVVPALALLVPAGLVAADLVPRGLAAEMPARHQRALRGLLAAAAPVLAPLLLAEWLLGRLLRLPGAAPLVALRRLGGWLAARAGRGPLEVSEAGLVVRIARFASKTARDVLVPHVDVCAVPDTASVGDVVALVQERGFSRIPVFHERMFNTIGIVSSLDLLGVVDPNMPVTAVMRAPLFLPESKPLPELLAALQAEGRNLAVVVDEYGGAVGLVTVEDLVEEIVGEIEDEYDARRSLYRRLARGIYVVSARARVAEVNERFGWNLPQGEYETLGGLVLERLGRVPKPGDSLHAGRVQIEVTRASARAVQELRVQERLIGR